MTNPQYQVTITYEPLRPSGKTGVYATAAGINGNVYSTLVSETITYRGGFFVANMHELKISATGSSYANALSNLLVIATASTTSDNGQPPLNTIKTW
jgi:hypothetical protein